jgi:6-phosphogluconolactonase
MIEVNRRRFLQMAGSASLLSAAGGRLGWAVSKADRPRFAYVGTEDAIHVFSIASGLRLVELQKISAVHAAAMVLGEGKLYVANGVSQFENLPRGSVTAYAIDRVSGCVEQINRVPLSLSATMPRALALAPDGRSLVVAIHGGGAYNVVSIGDDGRLGRVTGILKEIGAGPHPLQTSAHPSDVVFDRQGRVLTADMGADRLNVLGLSNGQLSVSSRCEVSGGSGPGCVVLHPDGKRVYVAHALDGSLSSFAYDASVGLRHTQTIRVSTHRGTAALGMHPSGEVLYCSHGLDLEIWKIGADGCLDGMKTVDGVRAHALQVASDGNGLFGLRRDGVVLMELDGVTGVPLAPVLVASVAQPLSIAVV